jgi:hypothetical protein
MVWLPVAYPITWFCKAAFLKFLTEFATLSSLVPPNPFVRFVRPAFFETDNL